MTVALCASLCCGTAQADEDGPSPIVSAGREAPAAEALDVITWAPRWLVGALGKSAVATARFVHDGQLVPRYESQLAPSQDVRVLAFPTLLASTERLLSGGARLIVNSPQADISARIGFGGLHDWEAGTEVRLPILRDVVPVVFGLSLTAANGTDLEYLGVGQQPADDPRNAYAPGREGETALYDQHRRRVVASVGSRFLDDFQVLVSTSLDHREVTASNLDEVYRGSTVPRPSSRDWQAYHELTLRHDSRPFLAPPNPGWLAEVFGGVAHEVAGETAPLVRTGGTLALFLPLAYDTNILSPRLVIENVLPLSSMPLSFAELSRPFAHRGEDRRRDRSSWVLGLDYTWPLASFMSGRLFVDTAAVAPGLTEAFRHRPSFAGGLGIDLYSSGYGIGQISAGWSTDGPIASLRIGDPSPWGDRQRRE